MKNAVVIRYVGIVLLLNACFMFMAAIVSLFYGMDTGFYPLLLSFLITAIVGCFPLIFVPRDNHLTSKEGYVIVIASWIMSCLVGMLPYLIWGGEFSVMDAWFESTSGFTTTGSTILEDVEALPKGLLFWRSSTHWIGGVGVVLFALVVLPSIGRTKMTLSSVELSTLAKDNFRYNTKKILKIIIVVYVGLTMLETLMLMMAGMTLFDAINHSFSTLATGGFSTKNLSIMYYNNIWIEIVIMLFMVAAGIHFGLIYSSIIGKKNNIIRSEVSRYLFISYAVIGITVALNLVMAHIYDNYWEALRYGLFQVISYGSTTGFASTDAAFWPPLSMLLLIVVGIQCASAGSTTGGIKADRVLMLVKSVKARVLKLQHPNAVVRIKLNGVVQDDSAASAAILMISFFMLCLFIGTLALTAMNYDLLTSFTATVASLSNVGPGFGRVSNLANYNFFSEPAKFILTIVMLFGRLELFGLIHIFTLRSWR